MSVKPQGFSEHTAAKDVSISRFSGEVVGLPSCRVRSTESNNKYLGVVLRPSLHGPLTSRGFLVPDCGLAACDRAEAQLPETTAERGGTTG